MMINAHFNDIDEKLLLSLKQVSLSMFRKNFFGIFHGSISARLTYESFVINAKQAVFDDLNEKSLIALNTIKDYRWNESSIDTPIHAQIYKNYKNAKFIAYAMPPYSVSYSLKHTHLRPLDFFGRQILGEEVEIWDIGNYDTWYDRAMYEIADHITQNNKRFLIIKGYGIYAFDRDLNSLAKKIAVIENSCKILHFYADLQNS
ncbi:hypothetical protein CQA58_04805 [Helicobacter brantae]|uniref:Class II aldolase/adducin N-terminal domain-containing protein n=2 Tax=Helicobacter brantae TaxID=375927 RepID=A0A3D8IZZ3_9HELI|nr:class II aldolase and adducin N-terminal domain-containing protein [Helicobacter brantae]RDU70663.1 hypothetical protein CQA58_04805 [Helicobacter brantae]